MEWIDAAAAVAVAKEQARLQHDDRMLKAITALRELGVLTIGRRNKCAFATRFWDQCAASGLASNTCDNYLYEFRKALSMGLTPTLNSSRATKKGARGPKKTLEARLKEGLEEMIERVKNADEVSFSATNMIKHLTSALALVK
jgi:hypothetical protein